MPGRVHGGGPGARADALVVAALTAAVETSFSELRRSVRKTLVLVCTALVAVMAGARGGAAVQTPDGRLSEPRVRRVIADHRELLVALLKPDLDEAARVLERALADMREMVMEALRESGWAVVPRPVPG